MRRIYEGRQEVFGWPKDLAMIEDEAKVSMGHRHLNVTYQLNRIRDKK